jgi:hypothetical protein
MSDISFPRTGSYVSMPLLNSCQQPESTDPQIVIDNKISNLAQCKFCHSNKNHKLQSIPHEKNPECPLNKTPLVCPDCASHYEICLICMDTLKNNISREVQLQPILATQNQIPVQDDDDDEEGLIILQPRCIMLSVALAVVCAVAGFAIGYGVPFEILNY